MKELPAAPAASEVEGPGFVILDPYRLPGSRPGQGDARTPQGGAWVKGQLHCHTTRSDGRLSPPEVVEAYRRCGFDFVCLTDHHRLGGPPAFEGGLLVLPGEESLMPRPFPPLGPHLLRLLVRRPVPLWAPLPAKLAATVAEGGLAAACHPAWPGNLGTGRWPLEGLLDPRIGLVEILNHHSPLQESVRVWDLALARRGPDRPLWGIAVDDSHRPEHIGRGWVWVHVASPGEPPGDDPDGGPPGGPTRAWERFASAEDAADAVREALAAGRFYSSTGAQARFASAPPGRIVVHTDPDAAVRFVGPGMRTLQEGHGPEAAFQVTGDEGFVRVEVERPGGTMAWSQPFWVVPARSTTDSTGTGLRRHQVAGHRSSARTRSLSS